MSYLRYMCLFGLSLPPVVCRRAHVLFTLFVFVWFVFTSCFLYECSCLIYIICVFLVRLYLLFFVGVLMSYLCYLCLFASSLPPLVGVLMSYLCYFCLFGSSLPPLVGVLMSYLCYLCLFGSSLPPVVCRSAHVLFTLFVFVWFFFTSSCL